MQRAKRKRERPLVSGHQHTAAKHAVNQCIASSMKCQICKRSAFGVALTEKLQASREASCCLLAKAQGRATRIGSGKQNQHVGGMAW